MRYFCVCSWEGGVLNLPIIESVDSNVGIAWTCNTWQYIKISPNLKNGELISLYDNVLFVFECFHDQQDSQWCEKASWKYPTKQQQNGPNVFLLSSFFRRASSMLRQPLALVYAWNSSILYWAVHEPIAFSQLWSLARRSLPLTLKLWLQIWDAIFFICTYACALKDHLATTRNCYSRSLN